MKIKVVSLDGVRAQINDNFSNPDFQSTTSLCIQCSKYWRDNENERREEKEKYIVIK